MLALGLTGSAAMGKSTVALMFASFGVPVFDADRAVHALYRAEAVAAVADAFPGVVADGVVDRARLSGLVLGDPAALARLEALVHPLVRAREEKFRAAAASAGARVIVLDVPLLFETGAHGRADVTAVASATAAVQRERLLAREGVTAAKIAAILARQMPDEEKRRRAHFIIDTGTSLEETREAVHDLLRAVAGMAAAR